MIRELMALKITMKKDPSKPTWYSLQTKRWNKLNKKGWVFNKTNISDMISIQMERKKDNLLGGEFHVAYTKRDQSYKQIHTKLLKLCEGIDKRENDNHR